MKVCLHDSFSGASTLPRHHEVCSSSRAWNLLFFLFFIKEGDCFFFRKKEGDCQQGIAALSADSTTLQRWFFFFSAFQRSAHKNSIAEGCGAACTGVCLTVNSFNRLCVGVRVLVYWMDWIPSTGHKYGRQYLVPIWVSRLEKETNLLVTHDLDMM